MENKMLIGAFFNHFDLIAVAVMTSVSPFHGGLRMTS